MLLLQRYLINRHVHKNMQVYNESATPEQADALAIFNDFKAVGLDIRNAAEQLERETVPAN